jgi:hypothetical protein
VIVARHPAPKQVCGAGLWDEWSSPGPCGYCQVALKTAADGSSSFCLLLLVTCERDGWVSNVDLRSRNNVDAEAAKRFDVRSCTSPTRRWQRGPIGWDCLGDETDQQGCAKTRRRRPARGKSPTVTARYQAGPERRDINQQKTQQDFELADATTADRGG